MAEGDRIRLERTLGPLVVDWIEQQLCHGPGDVMGQPVSLDDEQVRFILSAYAIDDKGRRRYDRVFLSRPKGRGKSELAAMIGCAEALGPVRFAGWGRDGRPLGRRVNSPHVLCVATEEGQAGHVFRSVEYMLRNGAVSKTPGLDVGLTRVYLPDGGVVQPVTAKAPSREGGRESFVVADETHLWIRPELHHLHEVLRRNLSKRRDAEPWMCETSTMFAPGESSVAELSHNYAKAIVDSKITNARFLFDHRQAPELDFDDDEQLRAALQAAYGPAHAWMNLDRLISEARDPQTHPDDFKRYFLNVPTRREEGAFVSLDRWDELATLDDDPEEGSTCYIGLDGSRTFDTTCVAQAVPQDDSVAVGVTVFSTRQEVAHHVLHTGSIKMADVEDHVAALFDVFRVGEVAYDPRYLERSAELLNERLTDARIFAVEPQSRHMREALQTLWRLIVEGRVAHTGDPVLRAHLANCKVIREPVSGDIKKVQKIDQSKPIDAVVALALAVWRAERHKPSVYTQRGVIGV